jgi:hypothetical protein
MQAAVVRLKTIASKPDLSWRVFLACLLLAGLVRLWTAWPGDNFHDDIGATYRSLKGGLSADYLFASFIGHWGPVAALAQLLVVWAQPFNFHFAVAVVVLVAMAGQVLAFGFLRRLVGAGVLSLVLALGVVFSTLYAATFTQWSMGLLIALLLLFGAGMNYCYLRWRDSRRRVWLFATLTFGTLGVLSDPQFLPFVALLGAIAAFGTPLPGTNRRRAVDVIGASVAAAVILLLPVAVSWMTPDRGTISNSATNVWDVFYSLTFETFIPSLLGGPWIVGQTPFPEFGPLPPVVLSFTGQVALVFVLAALLMRRRAWLWLLSAVAMLAAVAVVAAVILNLDLLGVSELRKGRWGALVLLPVLAFVGLALTDGGRRDLSGWRLSVAKSGRTLNVIAAVMVVVLLESAWATTFAVQQNLASTSTRPFWNNIKQSLKENPDVTILDRLMPGGVLNGGFIPEVGHLSNGLKHFLVDQDFNAQADQFWVMRSDGILEPGVFEPNRVSPPGPNGDCGYAVAEGSTVMIPTPPGLFNWEWALKFDYLAGADGNLQVQTSNQDFNLSVRKGLHTTYLLVSGDVPDVAVSVADDSGLGVCVASISVGTFQPTP